MQLALHFTEKVAPDIPIPRSTDGIVNGISYNSYSRCVRKTCSSSIAHNDHGWDKVTSRDPIAQYSSVLKSLKAMRTEVELDCARKLHEIDKMILEASEGK